MRRSRLLALFLLALLASCGDDLPPKRRAPHVDAPTADAHLAD